MENTDAPVIDELEAQTPQVEQEDAPPADETPAVAAPEGEADAPAGDAPEGELVVTIGDAPSDDAEELKTPAIREIRKAQREAVKALREKEREARELQQQLEQLRGGGEELGAKPTIEAHHYDAVAYAEDLEKWVEKKARIDASKASQRAQEEAQDRAWQAKLADYGKAKAALSVPDFEEAEEAVQGLLSTTQQAIIVKGAANPALVVLALHRNSAAAKKLAEVTDPVEFAFAVARLEDKLKVQPRKPPPAPEKTLAGGASGAGMKSVNIEALREKARQTGDWTAYYAAKRQ